MVSNIITNLTQFSYVASIIARQYRNVMLRDEHSFYDLDTKSCLLLAT
jgi:hypothetical protein